MTGYRRYAASQLDVAARIALLRRAGIGLADIQRFLASPSASSVDAWLGALNAEASERRHALEALAYSLGLRPTQTKESTVPVTIHPISSLEELAEVFDLLGQQFDSPFDRSDGRRFGDLNAALPEQRDLLLVADAGETSIGGALGFKTSDASATLRVLAVIPSHRRQGVGRALLRAFEGGARRLGLERVSLGAGEEVGFYVRHGYQTMLLLQWVYDGSRYERESKAVLDGPLKGMEHSRSQFNGVPQLFVTLDEPNPTVRAQVGDLVGGARIGYCMTRRLDAGDALTTALSPLAASSAP